MSKSNGSTKAKSKTTEVAPPKLNVLVKLGKVSLGKEAASVRITISRDIITLDKADHCLCGRRLTGRIVGCREDEDPRQTNFLENDRHTVIGAFDVNSIGVNPDAVGCTLSFGVRDVNPLELAALANQAARLIVDNVVSLDDVPEEPTGDLEGQTEFDENAPSIPIKRSKRGKEAAVAD